MPSKWCAEIEEKALNVEQECEVQKDAYNGKVLFKMLSCSGSIVAIKNTEEAIRAEPLKRVPGNSANNRPLYKKPYKSAVLLLRFCLSKFATHWCRPFLAWDTR